MERRIAERLGFPIAALALALPASAGGGQGSALPFEELARGWIATHVAALSATPGAEELPLDDVVEHRLAHVRLGAFEVLVPPASLVDRGSLGEIDEALHALLQVQEQWLDWTSGSDGGASDLRSQRKTIASWLKSWTRALPRDPSALAGVDLFRALEPGERVLKALDDLAGRMSGGGGVELPGGRTARLVLMPTRRDFVGFVSLLGWKLPRWRGSYWVDGLRYWSECDYDGTRILALERAASGGDPLLGTSLDARNPSGLEEHVAQLATRSLLDAAFGERMEPALATAFANSVVIEGWGEVDTRVDGDLRARQTSARSVFVPGGNPNGGTLAARDANSRWRDGKGADHFVKVLRGAQKAGAKGHRVKRGEASGSFLLCSDGGGERTVVGAPFLLPGGPDTAPPDALAGDYAEFLRAYRTAFVYWLRERADGSSRKSNDRFALFLKSLATASGPDALASAAASTYGVPLSAPEMDSSSLEGRFLLWLGKR